MAMSVERMLKVLHKDTLDFFKNNPCFATKEFVDFITRDGKISRVTAQRYLRDYVGWGIIERVGRGRYVVSEPLLQALKERDARA